MQFSDEWKQIWPINSVFSPPLLNSNTSKNHHDQSSVGPLFFNPSPGTLFQLFSSPTYFSPRLTPPFPSLTLQRFLSTTSSSHLLYSTASSLVSDKTITHSDYKTNDGKVNNSLQLLTCPFSSTIYAFLPAGENLEKIGILVISVTKNSNLEVKHYNGKPLIVENNTYQHRITKLLINPVSDCDDTSKDNEGFVRIAYMLASCKYSVCWYSIKVKRKMDSSSSSCPVVECIGSKWFRSSAVVHACWSPHLVEESAVLLESDISLSGRGCYCGTCLLREEFCKDALHRWIDWRQKKDLVMGFGFVEQEISSQLSGPNDFGGFHLIRLMSSGNLEVQRYCASWKLEHISEKAHKESILNVESNDLYDIGELKYDLPKRHRFLMLGQMKKRLLDDDNAAADSNCNAFDEYAVNLMDDTDNLYAVPETKYSPFHLKTPVHTNMPGVNYSNMRSNPEKSAPVTPTNQSSGYNVKNEAMGPELFDEGCSYDLKFDDQGIELGQQGLQMSNRLVAHKLMFQKGLN